MPHLVWSRRAAANVGALFAYFDEDTDLADRVEAIIASGVDMLLAFPRAGRPVPSPSGEQRELILPFGRGAYLLLYQIDDDEITVVGVRHSSQPMY